MDKIDWNDYYVYTDEWGDKVLEHTVTGCNKVMALLWGSIKDAVETAKEHHEVCSLRG